MLTPDETTVLAQQIAVEHLEDGIEFCLVYEHEDCEDLDEKDQRIIHDKVEEILHNLSKNLHSAENTREILK